MLDTKAVFCYNKYVIYKKNIERTDFIEVTYNGDEKELYLEYSKHTKQTIDLKWDEVYS